MGANFTICCFRFLSTEENTTILRKRSTIPVRPVELLPTDSSDSDAADDDSRSDSLKWNFWRNTQNRRRPSAKTRAMAKLRNNGSRRESDRELRAFISLRDKADKDTEEWEQLNYDIHTLRYTKREVMSRWKKILLQLGYQNQVDAMLCVNKHRRFSRDQDQYRKAADLLKQLLDHTSLFPPGTGPQTRYLFVMDSLVSLDSAEDFVRLAKEKYPLKEG